VDSLKLPSNVPMKFRVILWRCIISKHFPYSSTLGLVLGETDPLCYLSNMLICRTLFYFSQPATMAEGVPLEIKNLEAAR
jgi:hypothetical protein